MIGQFAIFHGKTLGLGLFGDPLEGHDYKIVTYDMDHFYTKYGFVVCMSRSWLDYSAVVEGRLPVVHKRYRENFSNTSWLLIDHYGCVYRVEYYRPNNEKPTVDVTGLPVTGKSVVVFHTHDGDMDFMAGLVSATDDREKIVEACHRRCVGSRSQFHWFDMDEIQAELHKRFPLEVKDGNNT